MKTCTSCGIEKPLVEFFKAAQNLDGFTGRCKICISHCNRKRYSLNKERYREYFDKYKKENPDIALKSSLKRLYGMTLEQWDELMLNQGGVCAICEKQCRSGKRLAVDHIHGTNPIVIRGLLCECCNRGMGLFEDSSKLLNTAAKYADNIKNVK